MKKRVGNIVELKSWEEDKLEIVESKNNWKLMLRAFHKSLFLFRSTQCHENFDTKSSRRHRDSYAIVRLFLINDNCFNILDVKEELEIIELKKSRNLS